eukprot:5435425-Amphidinium_carterae.1
MRDTSGARDTCLKWIGTNTKRKLPPPLAARAKRAARRTGWETEEKDTGSQSKAKPTPGKMAKWSGLPLHKQKIGRRFGVRRTSATTTSIAVRISHSGRSLSAGMSQAHLETVGGSGAGLKSIRI